MVDERRTENGRWTDDTDDGACLYYKLTNEPKGSGELKKTAMQHKTLIETD